MAPTRRSSRNRSSSNQEIVAPGFGTASDIQRLSQDLGGSLPVGAVTAMMRAEGRGIRSKASTTATTTTTTTSNPLTSPSTSNAWADFIQEEGVSNVLNFENNNKKEEEEESSRKRRKTTTDAASQKQKAVAAASKMDDDEDHDPNAEVEYDLEALTANNNNNKDLPFGSLVQSGTLDSTLVGRKNLKATDAADAPYHLTVPTVLLPKIAITQVCTSGNAAHAIAIDMSHHAYGWGRNEGLVLGSSGLDGEPFGLTVPTPTLMATNISTAALGKSHTIFLQTDGTLHALGTNKSGQCGWRQNVKQSGTLKACVVPTIKSGTPTFCKIACGEDFSVALDAQGVLYTSGSSEYGQLANGETGEYFVSANKLAYNNGYGFMPQMIFHKTEVDSSSDFHRGNDQTKKTVQIPNCHSIRLQDIACGKHHALAMEATNQKGQPRIFSWGCGDYGCLGHGRQQDEYFPRQVEYFPKHVQAQRLAAGGHCSLVLTAQGHVYYWGMHKQGADAVMKPQVVDALANNQHVVTHMGAGAANVACTTDLGNTVVWGSGPYGELGLGNNKKSSAKPAFVDSLSGIEVLDMACGQGTILYVVKDDKTLPKVDLEAVQQALKP